MRINLFTVVSTLAVILAVSVISIAQAQQTPSQLNGAILAPEAMQQDIPEGMVMVLIPQPPMGMKPMLIPKEVFDQINKEAAPAFNTPGPETSGGALDGTKEPVRQAIEGTINERGGSPTP